MVFDLMCKLAFLFLMHLDLYTPNVKCTFLKNHLALMTSMYLYLSPKPLNLYTNKNPKEVQNQIPRA